jgi:hypothetical protein
MKRLLLAASLVASCAPTFAVDGCTVLLCLAGNWGRIDQCKPPVRKLFKDLAKGRAFPRCSFASAPPSAASGPAPAVASTTSPSSGSNEWASPGNCPRQYLDEVEGNDGNLYWQCRWQGVIRVRMDGMAWSDVWWSSGGASVTHYSPAAKAAMGLGQTTYDADEAAWMVRQAQSEAH